MRFIFPAVVLSGVLLSYYAQSQMIAPSGTLPIKWWGFSHQYVRPHGSPADHYWDNPDDTLDDWYRKTTLLRDSEPE